jgi:hypothetical protein
MSSSILKFVQIPESAEINKPSYYYTAYPNCNVTFRLADNTIYVSSYQVGTSVYQESNSNDLTTSSDYTFYRVSTSPTTFSPWRNNSSGGAVVPGDSNLVDGNVLRKLSVGEHLTLTPAGDTVTLSMVPPGGGDVFANPAFGVPLLAHRTTKVLRSVYSASPGRLIISDDDGTNRLKFRCYSVASDSMSNLTFPKIYDAVDGVPVYEPTIRSIITDAIHGLTLDDGLGTLEIHHMHSVLSAGSHDLLIKAGEYNYDMYTEGTADLALDVIFEDLTSVTPLETVINVTMFATTNSNNKNLNVRFFSDIAKTAQLLSVDGGSATFSWSLNSPFIHQLRILRIHTAPEDTFRVWITSV